MMMKTFQHQSAKDEINIRKVVYFLQQELHKRLHGRFGSFKSLHENTELGRRISSPLLASRNLHGRILKIKQ
eukprot:UN12610